MVARGLDRHERQIVQRDACALAQFHGLGHGLGEARFVNHALGRYAVGVLGHPLGVLGQGPCPLCECGSAGMEPFCNASTKPSSCWGQRLAAVAEQVADDRRAEAQLVGGGLQGRNLIVLAFPQVDEREGRNVQVLQALHVNG